MHSYSLGSTDFNLAGIADAEKNEKKKSKAMSVFIRI